MHFVRLVRLQFRYFCQVVLRLLIPLWSSLRTTARRRPIRRWQRASSSACLSQIIEDGVTSSSTAASPAASASKKDTATLPTAKRTLFPRENVQIGWKTTGRKWNVGAGMINMGNTCYLNSTLQALFHVPAIANWLLSDVQHRERCDDGGSGGSCIICAMAKTLIESQSNQGAIRPHLVYSKLRLVCKHLVPGRQEDAHEFLRYLVEAMEKSYLGRFKNSKELDQYSKETTPLNQILGGYLRSEVKCPTCCHISTTFQHFEDLLLDIRKANSIDEALEVYFARERLEENGYKCEACKRRVAATKQFSLERAPFALCIQLKRFSVMGGKINKHVELRSRLDLTPYSSPALRGGSNGKLLYRLTSMVTHLGSTQHCGHYTAIGHTDAGGYHVFDDSSVRSIGMHNLTTTNAYILFYELESPVGSAGLPNGVCRTKPSATVGQPSSTATLTSMGHLNSDGGGSSGTPGKGTTTSSSPLRVLGTGGSGGIFPSKLEQKSTFIGPVLPAAASSASSQPNTAITATSNGSVTAAGQQGTSFSLVSSSQKSEPSGSKHTVDASFSSPSSTASTLSNASPLASPVKGMQPQSSQAGSGQPNSKTPKPSSSNGSASYTPTKSNGALKDEKKMSTAAPLLPSMPKLVSSSNKINSPLVNAPTQSSVVSLVPYETDDSSSSDDDDDDGSDKRTAVLIANGGPKRPKQTPAAAGGVYQNGLKPAKVLKAAVFERSEDNDENDDEHRRTDAADERQEMAASRSPQLIKTKSGLWKVSPSSTADQLSFPDSGSSGGSAPSSKASSPATSAGSSPASSPGGGQQPKQQQQQQSHQRNGIDASKSTVLTNGHRNNGSNHHQPTFNGSVGDKRKPMAVNGYHQENQSNGGGVGGGGGGKTRTTNGEMTTGSGGSTVQMLLKLSHRGYGAPVKSWDGQETAMDRELASERREERKRQIEDDRETEMDRGRVKKSKGTATPNGSFGSGGGGSSNPFQSYQNGGKWNGNRNGGNNSHYNNHQNNYHRGGGSYYANGNGQRYHHGGSNSNGFRNNGRRFGGRNGGGAGGGGNFHSKSYHHHQRSESSGGGGGGMASGSGNNGSNGFHHR
ncbi:AGAP007521-PA-like protein [Anopheles sinensis]|uniref:Ubiquitin carboxyl-terminal hydrolase 36 n=1 Tax=Anopheles sinensis TaxID=74873 RepID=A0A084WNE9_ANOSI|nr:AGAP007521-PA-like protein [Anopheles sinensis]